MNSNKPDGSPFKGAGYHHIREEAEADFIRLTQMDNNHISHFRVESPSKYFSNIILRFSKIKKFELEFSFLLRS